MARPAQRKGCQISGESGGSGVLDEPELSPKSRRSIPGTSPQLKRGMDFLNRPRSTNDPNRRQMTQRDQGHPHKITGSWSASRTMLSASSTRTVTAFLPATHPTRSLSNAKRPAKEHPGRAVVLFNQRCSWVSWTLSFRGSLRDYLRRRAETNKLHRPKAKTAVEGSGITRPPGPSEATTISKNGRRARSVASELANS